MSCTIFGDAPTTLATSPLGPLLGAARPLTYVFQLDMFAISTTGTRRTLKGVERATGGPHPSRGS